MLEGFYPAGRVVDEAYVQQHRGTVVRRLALASRRLADTINRMAEWEELKGLYKVISGIKYDPQLLNRKFGMPVITYYGDNPDPMNFSERSKSYGSGVIKDMYLRLLLTQRYKDFQLIIAVLLVSWVIVAVALVGLWQVLKGNSESLNTCLTLLNTSESNMASWVNISLSAKMQGSTIVVG